MECEVWWKVGAKGCEALAMDEKTNKRVLVRKFFRSLIFSQKGHQKFKYPMTSPQFIFFSFFFQVVPIWRVWTMRLKFGTVVICSAAYILCVLSLWGLLLRQDLVLEVYFCDALYLIKDELRQELMFGRSRSGLQRELMGRGKSQWRAHVCAFRVHHLSLVISMLQYNSIIDIYCIETKWL